MDEIEIFNPNDMIGQVTNPIISTLISKFISAVFIPKEKFDKELKEIKSQHFGLVVTDLIKSGKMSYTELYRCKNLFRIAELADRHLHNNSEYSEPQNHIFDFDWFMRFYDAVGNISNEELQALWGKILAGEIKKPKSCSLRTLDIMRNMSAEEASAFDKLCKLVLTSGGVTYYVLPTGFYEEKSGYLECCNYIKSIGLSYNDTIIPLLEAGLLSSDHELVYNFDKGDDLSFYNDKVLCIVKSDNEERVQLAESVYYLTTSGEQLYKIISKQSEFESDKDYAVLCSREMKNNNKDLFFLAFDKINNTVIELY